MKALAIVLMLALAPATQANGMADNASDQTNANLTPEQHIAAAEERNAAGFAAVAFSHLMTAAAAGNSEGMYRVGEAFDRGTGVAGNQDMASHWYLKAAARGHADAMHRMAQRYRIGQGVPASENLATEWFDKAVAALSLAAIQEKINADVQASPGEDTVRRSIALLRPLVEAKKPDALHAAGVLWLMLARSDDSAEAMAKSLLTEGADLGSARASLRLGQLLLQDAANDDDKSQARRRFEEAASRGLHSAKAWLAYCHESGIGGAMDVSRAQELYAQAAAAGDSAAKARVRELENRQKAPQILDLSIYQADAAAVRRGFKAKMGEPIPHALAAHYDVFDSKAAMQGSKALTVVYDRLSGYAAEFRYEFLRGEKGVLGYRELLEALIAKYGKPSIRKDRGEGGVSAMAGWQITEDITIQLVALSQEGLIISYKIQPYYGVASQQLASARATKVNGAL